VVASPGDTVVVVSPASRCLVNQAESSLAPTSEWVVVDGTTPEVGTVESKTRVVAVTRSVVLTVGMALGAGDATVDSVAD
jgi:hypothetical protein